MKTDNRGVSLVELLCTIAILSITVAASAAMLVAVARMNHAVAIRHTQMQAFEQTVSSVERMIFNNYSTASTPHETDQEISFQSSTQTYHFCLGSAVLYDAAEYDVNTVYLEISGVAAPVALATNVIEFHIGIPEGKNYYELRMTFENGQTYTRNICRRSI